MEQNKLFNPNQFQSSFATLHPPQTEKYLVGLSYHSYSQPNHSNDPEGQQHCTHAGSSAGHVWDFGAVETGSLRAYSSCFWYSRIQSCPWVRFGRDGGGGAVIQVMYRGRGVTHPASSW